MLLEKIKWNKINWTLNFPHLARLVTEIFNGVRENWRRAVVSIVPPRQPHTDFRHVRNGGLRRGPWEGGWLWSTMEYHSWVRRSFNDQSRTPGGLAGLTHRLARVQAGVGFAQIWNTKIYLKIYSHISQSMTKCLSLWPFEMGELGITFEKWCDHHYHENVERIRWMVIEWRIRSGRMQLWKSGILG